MTELTATRRKEILREVSRLDVRDVVPWEKLVSLGSRHQTSAHLVRDLLRANGYSCGSPAATPKPEPAAPVAKVVPLVSPVSALVVRSILVGSIYHLLAEPDAENPDPWVVTRLSAFTREREALRKLLQGREFDA